MKNKGITLVALVVTIIILLILAGITISAIVGENGLLATAQKSAITHEKEQIQEEIKLAILDIETELRTKHQNTNLNNNILIEELPKKLENLIINPDLTGEYKGYEYWFDEELKVHIEGKIGNPIKVTAEVTYTGTSSCTLKVDANSSKGNIVGYKYKINNEEVTEEITQSEYTLENLNPDTKYYMSVEVIDEQGNRKDSIPVTITTKSRTYLIKDGVEQVEGQLANATKTQEDGYLKLAIKSTTARGGWYITQNLTNYKKVKTDVEVISKGASCKLYTIIYLSNPLDSNDSKGNCIISDINITKKAREEYTTNIASLQGNYMITCWKNKTSSSTSAVLHIYNLWLEE